jgi:hypothetical protein
MKTYNDYRWKNKINNIYGIYGDDKEEEEFMENINDEIREVYSQDNINIYKQDLISNDIKTYKINTIPLYERSKYLNDCALLNLDKNFKKIDSNRLKFNKVKGYREIKVLKSKNRSPVKTIVLLNEKNTKIKRNIAKPKLPNIKKSSIELDKPQYKISKIIIDN